jgi:hypothetical protein
MTKVVGNKKYRISSTTGDVWVLEWRHNTWEAWLGQDWNIEKIAQTKQEIKTYFDKV